MENLVVGLKQAKWLVSAAVAVLAVFSLSFGNIAVAEEEKKKKELLAQKKAEEEKSPGISIF